MTLRMVMVTIVGLYTSRIVLETLGVVDYGIYALVGGIVAMASFLNNSMSGATSRFITFELGKGDIDRLKRVFSSALIIHFTIALVVVLIAETLGLWYVNKIMVIPPDRLTAANIVYQISVLSVLISFTQVPYSALIIAHERMTIYAYFELVNVILKLLIVYILLITTCSKLILYAALMFLLSAGMAFIYRIYCIRNFNEARFQYVKDKSLLKTMMSFSAYNIYTHMALVTKDQGISVVMNLFFGIVVNAAASLAQTLAGAVNGLTLNIFQAFRPQIIKQYSSGDIRELEKCSRRAAQFTMLAFSLIAIPIVIDTESLLYFWLHNIPEYSVPFTRLIIIAAFFSIVMYTNIACIHATGKVKNYSFISGTLYLITPVATYIWMYVGGSASTGYICNAIVLLLTSVSGWWVVKNQIPEFKIHEYIISTLKSWFATLVSLVIVWIIFLRLICSNVCVTEMSDLLLFGQLALLTVVSLVVAVPITALIAFNRSEIGFLISKGKDFAYRISKGNRS